MVKIGSVMSHQDCRLSGHSQFNQVIIPFVGEIGSPKVINLGQLANRQKSVQQGRALVCIQRAIFKHGFSAQHIPILSKQCQRDAGLQAPSQAGAQHGARGATATAQSSDKNIRINDDLHALKASTDHSTQQPKGPMRA